jgi:hypothetical protein
MQVLFFTLELFQCKKRAQLAEAQSIVPIWRGGKILSDLRSLRLVRPCFCCAAVFVRCLTSGVGTARSSGHSPRGRASRDKTCTFYWDYFQGTIAVPISVGCTNRETGRRALFRLGFLSEAEGK